MSYPVTIADLKAMKPNQIIGKIDWNESTNKFYLTSNDIVCVQNKNGTFGIDKTGNLRKTSFDCMWNQIEKSEAKELVLL